MVEQAATESMTYIDQIPIFGLEIEALGAGLGKTDLALGREPVQLVQMGVSEEDAPLGEMLEGSRCF